MRQVFRILVLAVAIVAIGLVLAALPGRVTAEFGTVSVDFSTPVAVLALLALAVLTHLLLGLAHLPRRLARRIAQSRRRRGDLASTRALVALAAADPTSARREAGRARRLLGDTPQTLLLAAEAARLAGRDAEAAQALAALAGREDAAFLGLRGQLRQAIAKSDWKAANELAVLADEAYPGVPWLREDRTRLAIRAGDWTGAMRLAGDNRAKAALATAAAEAQTDPARALTLARQAWEADGALAPAALAYASRLRASGQDRRAERVIADTWAIRPHPDLAAFALAAATNPPDALPAARKLVAANPNHPESHLLLARAALAGGAIPEARREVQAAREAGLNQRRLFLLMAEIERMEGQSDAASAALRQAAEAEPDPAWRCTECHTPAAAWEAACPVCLTPASLACDGLAASPEIRGRTGGIGGAVRRILPAG